ncbi:hypothetical protein BO70DRAFT_430343 [Aspergillus heteromorphus CBS 117.55]|uniref:P-loop containing nucleoside triphosphate hydrolase protein n=1 Tax=Aspergillus heteromorphus CBS 117.55 TaxID=1448321 RepID=A0A317VSU9_9EURO|nr:uncharacterized protein BO70DRAFT_430343 [Aspergillus heteromorphus CBS 117.55]PWY77403.1 hypothetical protein BO70DRAFT_430343 [Aspergillus heteromorphus CBS 117.55]
MATFKVFVIGKSQSQSTSPPNIPTIILTHFPIPPTPRRPRIRQNLPRARADPTKLQPHVVQAIREKNLVEIKDLIPILEDVARGFPRNDNRNVLLDGLPRSMEQIAPMEAVMGTPDLVLYFDCPKDIARQRFLSRDVEGRVDDEKAFGVRGAQFAKENKLILQHYLRMGVLVRVDTSGSFDACFEKLKKDLTKEIAWRGTGIQGFW